MEKGHDNDKSKPRTKTQWIAVTEVLLIVMMLIANNGWISPFLGKMSRPDPPFSATTEQLSWFASMNSLCKILGIVTGFIKTEYFGAKISLYLCGFYYAVAWVSLICANSIHMVIINQLFCGLSYGAVYATFPIYLGEIVNANIRGTVISFVLNGGMVGLLYGNLLGANMEPWVFGLVNLIITVIYLVTFYFLPSTPYYYISHNKLEQAEKALRYYNDKHNVTEEFTKLHEFMKSSPRLSVIESLRRLKDPINLKTFMMINVVYSFVQFSGTYVLLEYQEVIIMAGNIEIIRASTLVSIMSAIALPASWVAVAISDNFGRVTMLTASCVVFCISLIGWGLSFHLAELGFSTSDVQWLVIACALTYRLNLTVGLNPIVPVLISEFFAPNVKNISSCLVNIISALCVFISVKNFPVMVDHMSYKYLLYFYAVLILAVGFYSLIYIPETRGKTLQEIQEMFLNNHLARTRKVSTQVYVNTECQQTSSEDVNTTKL